MADTTHAPTLYALLVGVGIYQSRSISNLSSVNDAEALKTFLEGAKTNKLYDFGENIHIQTLYDAQATKANIVDGFEKHLGQAKAGDTALFFFAGHGVREETTEEIFRRSESDGKIAGIVCVGTEPFQTDVPEATTLSDKEMRYLIRKIAADDDGEKAHVVTIFDCCHSGGNTRSALEAELPANARQLQRGALKARTWEGFIFHDDEFVKGQIKEKNETDINKVLPHGNHVMLAACREVELAWERGGKGNFTTALIEVLRQHGGKISYHELHTRVVNQMRFQYLKKQDGANDQRQTPQFYLNSPHKSDRYNLFLSNDSKPVPKYGAIEYIEQGAEKEWRLALGALHGVPIGEASQVEVYAGASEDVKLTATVKHVFPSHCSLKMPSGFQREQGVPYRGLINALGIPPLKICIIGEEEKVKATTKSLNTQLEVVKAEAIPAPFEMKEQEDEADYTVLIRSGAFQIVLPFDYNDNRSRPRVNDLPYLDSKGEVNPELYTYLAQISQWTFFRNLERTGVFAQGRPNYPIEVRAFYLDSATQQEHPLSLSGNVFTVDLPQDDPFLPIRFELINRSPEQLYVGLAYLEHTFGVESEADDDGISFFRQNKENPFILSPAGAADQGDVLRSTGGEVEANGHNYTEIGSGGYIFDDNWLGYTNFFKLIVSQVDFDIKSFHMDSLPHPHFEDDEALANRGSFMRERKRETPPPKWEIQTLELYVANPVFKPDTF